MKIAKWIFFSNSYFLNCLVVECCKTVRLRFSTTVLKSEEIKVKPGTDGDIKKSQTSYDYIEKKKTPPQ